MDHERKVTKYFHIITETLEALRNTGLRENEKHISNGHFSFPKKEQSIKEQCKPIPASPHSHLEDLEAQIKELMDDNGRLRIQNGSFENANNGLIYEMDEKDTKT